MKTTQRLDLEQIIFNYLKDNNIVKEGKHYTLDPNGMGNVWSADVYATVVKAVFAIDEVL